MSHSPEYTYSELPALELFKTLGYDYLYGPEITERDDINEVILKSRLREAILRLNPWMNDDSLEKAFMMVTSFEGNSLMEINQDIWGKLQGSSKSIKQILDGKEEHMPVRFIDFENIENNDFLVVNQMRFKGKADNSVPDIVVYVNGLPLAVIECKSPKASEAWDKAYSDLNYYQKNSERLFYFNQICAGIWEVGGKYGAICSPKKFYSVFKTKGEVLPEYIKTEQDRLIFSLFRKDCLLDIIRNFVIFELDEGRTIKKLPRYQQIRATNKVIERLKEDMGGVVWHTQGSGKSITMAYVTRKLQAQENGFENPTVLVMTDRKDLDRQITNTFRNVGFKNVCQAGSVAHLDDLLRNDYGGIITTTLQKFQERDSENAVDQTQAEEMDNVRVEKLIDGNVLTKITRMFEDGKWVVQDTEKIVLEELSSKKNLYVLVDEAHRSHYGFLAAFMRSVLPHAKFVAFTGTPISKEDKSTLAEFYGGSYIDIYTIKEAVADGATVELMYDAGIARMDIKKEELDKEFEEMYGDESEEKKDKLKSEALRKYRNSKDRVREIAKHIVDNFSNKIFKDKHKAMIVCSGRESALRYKKELEALKAEGYHSFESKVVVSLGSPKADKIANECYEALKWNKEHKDDKKPVWVVPSEDVKQVTEDFKLPFGDVEDLEKSGKKKHDNTAFLIVSDMLLTGYDAPIASCLYLDKPLKEHNLLQAIARVNRSRDGKNAGYIMDYCGITNNLLEALKIFSGEEELRPDDIMTNINEEIPRLEANHAKLLDFFKSIRIDRHYNRDGYIDKAICFIEPVDKRDLFKSLLKAFNKSVNIVLPNTKALEFLGDFKLFNEIKLKAMNAYRDDKDLKISPDESKMLQTLIDEHLKAEGVDSLLEGPVSILDRDKFEEEINKGSDKSKELKLRNNLKYTIKVGIDKNPDFFKPLAARLEELLMQKEHERITEAGMIQEMSLIWDDILEHEKESKRLGFDTDRRRAVYDSMKTIFNGGAKDATLTVFDLVEGELGIVGWESKGKVKKDMENKIMRFLKKDLGRSEAKIKAVELVNIMAKNKDE